MRQRYLIFVPQVYLYNAKARRHRQISDCLDCIVPKVGVSLVL